MPHSSDSQENIFREVLKILSANPHGNVLHLQSECKRKTDTGRIKRSAQDEQKYCAHDLMYLGMDGSPVYNDDLSRRNGEVYRLTTALYNSGVKGSTVEEQANVCLALLMG